jgi:hypothetical protein
MDNYTGALPRSIWGPKTNGRIAEGIYKQFGLGGGEIHNATEPWPTWEEISEGLLRNPLYTGCSQCSPPQSRLSLDPWAAPDNNRIWNIYKDARVASPNNEDLKRYMLARVASASDQILKRYMDARVSRADDQTLRKLGRTRLVSTNSSIIRDITNVIYRPQTTLK